MKLYIEGIVILALFFTIIFGVIWNQISVRRLLKKYNKEDDKGRNGNSYGKSSEEKSGVRSTNISNDGLGESERREILSETKPDNDGETDKGSRRTRFFRRK